MSEMQIVHRIVAGATEKPWGETMATRLPAELASAVRTAAGRDGLSVSRFLRNAVTSVIESSKEGHDSPAGGNRDGLRVAELEDGISKFLCCGYRDEGRDSRACPMRCYNAEVCDLIPLAKTTEFLAREQQACAQS